MLEHTKSLPEGFFSGLELLGAAWDDFSLPSERGTSGFQVVPEINTGLAKIFQNQSWLLLLGPTGGCFVGFVFILNFFLME